MSPSIRKWPTRCMATRLWKPAAGTDLANSDQLPGAAARLKAAPGVAPGRTATPSPACTVVASSPLSTVKESAASFARRCKAGLPSRAAPRRANAAISVARLDVGVLDDLAPFRDVVGDRRPRFLGRAADDVEAEDRELLLHLGIGQHLQRLRAYLVEDRLRRAGRRHQGEPGGGFEAGKARFDHRLQVRRIGRALQRGDGDAAHPAIPDQRQAGAGVLDADRDYAAHHIGEIGTPIGDVLHLDTGKMAEKLARDVLRRAD